MGQQNPDEIAKKYGGVRGKDIEALAAKYGGSVEPPPSMGAPPGGPQTYMPPAPSPPSFGGFLENAAQSIPKAAGNVLQLLNPQTYKNLAKVVGGGVESFFPENNPHFSREEVPYWNAAKNYVVNRVSHPLKTLYEDPAGAMVDLSAVLSGGAGLMRGGAAASAELAPDVSSALARTGEIAGQASHWVNPLEAAVKGAGFVNRAAGKTALAGIGLTTGRGAAAEDLWDTAGIKANIPGVGEMSRAKAAMQGKITDEDTVNNLKDMLVFSKDKKLAEYQPKLAAAGPIDLTDSLNRVKANFDRKLGEFWIRRVPNQPEPPNMSPMDPTYEGAVNTYRNDLANWQRISAGRNPGDINFEGSGIEPESEAGAKILEMNKLLSKWQDYSSAHTQPIGMDLLKRRVDDMYSDSSMARAVVQSLKSDIRGELESNVPGYREMTDAWHKQTNFEEWLASEFSLDNKNPSVAMRKLNNALVNNTGQRRELVERLNEINPGAGDSILAEIAGHHFSGFAPKGIMGPMSGMGLVYNFLRGRLSPETLMAMPLISPKMAGSGIIGLKSIAPAITGTGRVAGAVASNPLLSEATRAANAPMTPEDLSKVKATVGPANPSLTRESTWNPVNSLQPVKR